MNTVTDTIDKNGKLTVRTNNSVYHLGQADSDGVRTITREGRELGFERGILLGPCDVAGRGLHIDENQPLIIGRAMAIKLLPEDRGTLRTTAIRSIENTIENT